MTRPLSILWRWIAYGFYAILIFVICVYLTFPTHKFHAWLLAEVDQRFGVQITAQALQSHTPLHIDIDGATLSLDPARIPTSGMLADGIHALPIERLSLELHAWPLVFGRGVLNLEIKVFGGVMRGTLTAEKHDNQWRYHVHGGIEGMHLQQLEERLFVPREPGPVVTGGTGALRFDLAWTGENVRSAAGTISVNMGDAVVNVPGLISLTISELSGSLIRDQRGWWRSDDVRVVGENDGFAADGQGRFLFDDPFPKSMVNLSVSITMDAAAKRQYPQLAIFMPQTGKPAVLTVNGPLGRPIVLINGVPILAR